MADPYEFLTRRLQGVVPSDGWRSDDPDWAGRTRAALRRCVGAVDEPWPDAAPELGELQGGMGFARRWVSFPSREGWNASGWLLVPVGLSAPAPAVICLPGHGAGADAIAGLIDEPYQANFALQCIEQGWITLALEQVSFGHNRSANHGGEPSSCLLDSMFALQIGETMTGWRVRDAMAAARFLRAIPEVDENRIATLGISGGGLTALYTAALDPSILAAGVSGFFTPMAHSILRFRHCPDNYVPGLARSIDVPDLAGLIAPRWLAVENGAEDHIFAIEGFRVACAMAREIYSAAGYPERFESAEFEGGHLFEGAGLLEHLAAAFSS